MYMKHMDINNFNTWAKNNILDENRFDDDGFIIMENDYHYKTTGVISHIFGHHFLFYHSYSFLYYNFYKKYIFLYG